MAMTHTQRLRAVVEKKPVDRPAVAAWGPHFNMEDRNAKDLATATINYQNAHQFDFIKMMPNGMYFLEDYGQVVRWAEDVDDDSWRNTIHYVVNDPSEWKKIGVNSPKKGALAREVEAVKRVCDYFKDDVPVLPTVFGPLQWAKDACGGSSRPDVILSHIRHYPNEVHKALANLAETNAALMEEFIKAGAAGFFYAQWMGAVWLNNCDLLTPEEFTEFGAKYDIPLLEGIQNSTWFTMIHMHGTDGIHWEIMKDYPVAALNWDDRFPNNPDICEIRAKTDKVLIGGIDRMNDMLGNDRETIKQRLRDHIEDAIRQNGSSTNIVLSGGCGWNRFMTPRFMVLQEVIDEIAASWKE